MTCTTEQQVIRSLVRSSNLFACTSCFSAVVAKLLISRLVPCNKLLFLVKKFHFRLIPKNYREYHQYSCKKAGISRKYFSTREGRSADNGSKVDSDLMQP